MPIEITAGDVPGEAALVVELASGATLRVSEGCSPELLRTAVEALRC